MDQIQNGLNPEFLQQLLANPAAVNAAHQQQLKALVQTYPACSIFRLLLAKSVQNTDAETAEKAIQAAAVHTANREILFRLIHQPELIVVPKPNRFYGFVLPETDQEKINQDAVFIEEKLPDETSGFAKSYPVEIVNTSLKLENQQDEITFSEDTSVKNIAAEEATDDAYIEPEPAEIEDEEAVFVEDIPSEEKSNASFTDQNPAENKVDKAVFGEDISSAEKTNAFFTDENLEEAMAAENDFRVEDVSQTFANEPDEELVFPEQTILAFEENLNFNPKPANQEIDEEVFEEIIAIEDINFEVVKEASPQIVPEAEPEIIEPEVTESEVSTEPEIASEEKPFIVHDDAEKAMLSNIASIDYFSFNHKFGQNKTAATEKEAAEDTDYQIESAFAEAEQPVSAENEKDTVSKYHDDKMPYTFMWWLDKTRKEYAGTYQPYTKNVQKTQDLSVGPELHQQYIESIFHTKAPLKVPENTLPLLEELPVKKKEKQLIERFIIEEPHIHPPSMDKLDTENKAKKSSEDGDIFVTETLAKVYLDQMLYHKALDTYKKLMLKFPEKSVYFAAQLTEIEKKLN
ncbi:MAG: hypothetical protein ACRYGB_11620 [Janthinobacterium lividum]